MRTFVTGCAGFIGSTLVDRLLADGHDVVGYDNFSTGQPEFLKQASANPRFRLVRGDTLDFATLKDAMAGCETVFHLAANADVRFGTHHPKSDLEQNTIATFHVLDAMRITGAQRIAMRTPMKVGVFNLGTDEYCEVNDSIGWICDSLGLAPKRQYAGGIRGWVGDSPFIFLNCSKIRALGWKPKLTIREGVVRTVKYLEQNPWILERRG